MTDPLDAALRQLAQEIDDNTPLPHPWQRVTSPASATVAPSRRRHRLVLAIATVAVLVAGGIGIAVARRSPGPRRQITVTTSPQPAPDSTVPVVTPPPASTAPAQTTTAVSADTTAVTTVTTAPTAGAQGVPAFVVQDGASSTTVAAATYCFAGVCADGVFDPATFPVFAAGPDLTVVTPSGWPLSATFRRHGVNCAAGQTVVPVETSPGVFRIDPAGAPGVYDVTLGAQAPAGSRPGGDAIATVVWTTTGIGPVAVPSAQVAVLANRDGTIDSYGVELNLANLATQPVTASATIGVTSAEGTAITLTPAVAGGGPDCPFGETGSIWFRASADSGRQAAALGSAPFTYDVSVTLDDVTYTARAVWPNDETPDHAPYVDLHFDPPLPVVRLPAPTKLVIDRQDIESDTPDIVPVACGRDFVRGYDDRPVAAGVPDAALSSFLSTHAAGTFFRLGYEQFHVLDTDSYRYEVRNDTGGLVTVVFVERLADGWAATHWQASPC